MQVISSEPQAMGAWQMTVFQIHGPKEVMIEERATIATLFPNYVLTA